MLADGRCEGRDADRERTHVGFPRKSRRPLPTDFVAKGGKAIMIGLFSLNPRQRETPSN
jgi:hypothetical protein